MVQSAWIIVFSVPFLASGINEQRGGSHFSPEDDVLRTEDDGFAGDFIAGVLGNRVRIWGGGRRGGGQE